EYGFAVIEFPPVQGIVSFTEREVDLFTVRCPLARHVDEQVSGVVLVNGCGKRFGARPGAAGGNREGSGEQGSSSHSNGFSAWYWSGQGHTRVLSVHQPATADVRANKLLRKRFLFHRSVWLLSGERQGGRQRKQNRITWLTMFIHSW